MTSTTPTLISPERGDGSGSSTLFATLYSELHRLARRELARNGTVPLLGATTLLHEAYLDIRQRDAAFVDRERFLGYAARVMRGLIIDYTRHRQAQKRGGQVALTSIGPDTIEAAPDHRQLIRISDALDALGRVDPQLAEIVDLKFFCGFSIAEIAGMRGVSERTVQRTWEKARLYLHRALSGDGHVKDV